MLHVITRVLVFLLGLVIVLDAVFEDPSPPLVIVVGLLLMGVITADQVREIIRRNGGASATEEEANNEGTGPGTRSP